MGVLVLDAMEILLGHVLNFMLRFVSYAVAVVPSTQRNVVSICVFAC